ncbi:MAG TPA: hypothetical protein VFN13_11840 [Rudaea sp.]|nr:hypothetical protein [Rudaea sp.]
MSRAVQPGRAAVETDGHTIAAGTRSTVDAGDALVHVAHLRDPNRAGEHVENIQDSPGSDAYFDDEIG